MDIKLLRENFQKFLNDGYNLNHFKDSHTYSIDGSNLTLSADSKEGAINGWYKTLKFPLELKDETDGVSYKVTKNGEELNFEKIN